MNYYTATIPFTLAEKLKEKGMPIITRVLENYLEGGFYPPEIVTPSYADVFDWLMSEKDTRIYIVLKTHFDKEWYPAINEKAIFYKGFRDWHEAANAAIEKAIQSIE